MVSLAAGSSRERERRITELHLLEEGWEYVFEFGGTTAAYDLRRSIARSFQPFRT